jgi:hypothetical protein
MEPNFKAEPKAGWRFLGRGLLLLFFIAVLTPLGLVLRLAGKDALRLKRRRQAKTYWREAKDCSPLNRLY